MTRPLLALSFLALLICYANAAPDTYVVVTRTNWVPQATQQVQVSSNMIGTNAVLVITNVVYLTNMVPHLELETRTNVVVVAAQAQGGGGDGGAPDWFGPGGIVLTLIAAILGALAKWQSTRRGKLNTTLGQNVETYSEFTKAQPNGVTLDAAIKREIVSQQVVAGVKKMAADVHDNEVNPVEAKAAASRVLTLTA